jgi:LacI family transcriptional regulator
MTATIADVAREADVSISTVSRVLNRPYLVNKTTRRRVQDTISALSYRPNVFAQALMRSRSDLEGLAALAGADPNARDEEASTLNNR